ncbi:MAG: RidA family protein [Anaerolineales bacterium]|nr:RidA family protein [Anaerolineales bacterium]
MNQEKIVIATGQAPAAVGPYSQAIKTGNLVFTAGQIGLDPETGELVQGGIRAQTRRTLQNISAILEAAGSSLEQVLKTTVFLSDISQFGEMNAVYAEFFSNTPPARATAHSPLLPKGALIEIDAVAICS